MTRREVLEVASDVVAGRDGHVAAEEQRGDDAASHGRVGVDLAAEQRDEQRCALGVPDEHDTAAVVVVGEVVVPRGEEACVGDRGGVRLACSSGRDRVQGQLSIHRCEDPTG